MLMALISSTDGPTQQGWPASSTACRDGRLNVSGWLTDH